ncbi:MULTISPECIES: universal stress protein UspB [Morganella]|jgi:universal stress protein B|uniref:Universal stress protein B n=2 Tax=Morganella morganii TaxID=582 RepID=A0AAN5MFM9_MORMO|nr:MULTISPECIES: universal stress protein UspB [Morganella]ELA9087873.1 universal stress protein UspB [Morganella morganii]MCU6210576.1 universal stress protein UspB [Morganella morganii]MCU6238550.1 universal stress protein UspB [Morganella morganii]MCU6275618.1 universal stress protein UspB [Morganella morganii]MCU6376604.1 universal stress protein UspB [Morganella morganii]
MFSILTLFWALCFLCLINMIRFYSSTRALLFVLRDSDPLLYHAVGGNNAFTDHTQWQKQLRLIRYINQREYLTHHDPEVILRCGRIRRQFTMISAICGIVIASLLMMIIWP